MVNQENTAVGSYPEMRVAVEAAVDWINAELGGIGGNPVELDVCIVPFDPVLQDGFARRMSVDRGPGASAPGMSTSRCRRVGAQPPEHARTRRPEGSTPTRGVRPTPVGNRVPAVS